MANGGDVERGSEGGNGGYTLIVDDNNHEYQIFDHRSLSNRVFHVVVYHHLLFILYFDIQIRLKLEYLELGRLLYI